MRPASTTAPTASRGHRSRAAPTRRTAVSPSNFVREAIAWSTNPAASPRQMRRSRHSGRSAAYNPRPMNAFWSRIAHELSPYVPGAQPRVADLVKLNTNESPFGPSPLALEAMRAAAADTLRLYPDPEATELREALAAHHGVKPEQVFVGNGSDEVLAHAFVALLKQPKPLLFPDVTYSFYPVWAQLFGLACETVPLDDEMRVRVEDYRREAGSIIIANPNAPTGVALPRAEIARLLEDHPDIPVVIDEAYVDFGGESAVPLIA